MIRLNNRGFMMAEVVVVSSIVLIFLTTIFTSFNKMYATYIKRVGYYDVVTLYRLGYYRDILIENNKMSTVVSGNQVKEIYGTGSSSNLFSLPETEVSDNVEDRVFLIPTLKSSGHAISATALDSKSVNQTFKDYIKYLSTSVTPQSNYIMVMERCNVKGGEINIDDCKYAYLEIFDTESAIDYTEPVPTSTPTPTTTPVPGDCFKEFDGCPNGWKKENGKCYHYASCNSIVYGCKCYDYKGNITFESSALSSASQCTSMQNGGNFYTCTPYTQNCKSCPPGYSPYDSPEYCWKYEPFSECAGDGWEKREGRCYRTSCG